MAAPSAVQHGRTEAELLLHSPTRGKGMGEVEVDPSRISHQPGHWLSHLHSLEIEGKLSKTQKRGFLLYRKNVTEIVLKKKQIKK